MRWTHDLENGGLIFDMRKNASAKMLRRLLLAMAAAFCLTMLALPAAAEEGGDEVYSDIAPSGDEEPPAEEPPEEEPLEEEAQPEVFDGEDLPLEEGSYFIQDLIGLRVVDADDSSTEYGILKEVSPTGANDVYHIVREGKTVLIPAIRQVIVETDPDQGIMRIRPLEGLFDAD